jgi:hypothetical protein
MKKARSIGRCFAWLAIGVGLVIVLVVYLGLYRTLRELNAYSISPLAQPVEEEPNSDERVPVVRDISIDKRGMSPKVENGAAFDKSTEKVGAHTTVVIPEEAIFVRGGAEGVIEMYMTKTLLFYGHPPKEGEYYYGHPSKENRLSIRHERNAMGCSCGSEGDKFVFMTFGAWFTKEGGASIMVRFVVPENLRVETRRGLTGKDKVVPKQVKCWHDLPFEPDPRRID